MLTTDFGGRIQTAKVTVHIADVGYNLSYAFGFRCMVALPICAFLRSRLSEPSFSQTVSIAPPTSLPLQLPAFRTVARDNPDAS
jgi:hypothetical protein